MSMPLVWPVRMHSDNQLTHDRLADCVAQAMQRPSSRVGSRPLNVTVAVRPTAVLRQSNRQRPYDGAISPNRTLNVHGEGRALLVRASLSLG